MFAPVGRRDYDEARIRGSESLLHVLVHAGATVHWRDNQSGCKGVCAGLPQDEVVSLNPAGLCSDGRCFDEGLLVGLNERLAAARTVTGRPATQLLVLHQLGSHGPAYFRRYPPAFAHFTPACENDDLQKCTREEIVNAYDNSLRYTDHVLGQPDRDPAAQRGGCRLGADLRVRPRRIARRAQPLSARPAVVHRPEGAEAGADGDVAVVGHRQRKRESTPRACVGARPSRHRTTTCSTRCSACST